MATSQLIGPTFPSAATTLSGGYICTAPFVATFTGLLSEIKMLCFNNGNFQGAVYTDVGGVITALKGQTATSTAVTTGSNTIPLTAATAGLSVVSGTTYWLAINTSVYGVQSNNTSGTTYYRLMTFGTSFPDPCGGGFASLSGCIDVQGWGAAQTFLPDSYKHVHVAASGMWVPGSMTR